MTIGSIIHRGIKAVRSIYYSVSLWVNKLISTVYYWFRYRGHYLRVNCWVDQKCGRLVHRNFGDELNIYLIEALTGKPVVCSHSVFSSSHPNYMVIGSVVDVDFCDSNTIVWGAGCMWGNREQKYVPQRVCATRGKLTQKYLSSHGVTSPDVYGDPALLLPLVYAPTVVKKYKIGVIPNVIDLDHPCIKSLLDRYPDLCHLICFCDYSDWHSVIDSINQCEAIISTSLHGLVLADAYDIPNIWAMVDHNILGGDFKYYDYFSGVGRIEVGPLDLQLDTDINEIKKRLVGYRTINYDVEELIASAPFPISLDMRTKE